jgi:putative glycosyltransferase
VAALIDQPGAVGLTIVSTLYQSEAFVGDFCARAAAVARAFGRSYEIVLVNDGSPDGSLDAALEAHRRDPNVVVVDLSRNFGHHKAIMTGLAHARGELVFLLDSDLEEQPEWLDRFHAELQRHHADVVYGVQETRKGGVFERLTGALFYATFNAMLELPLPKNVVTARLMTRRYVQELVQHRDREVCLAALWVTTGFAQVGLPVQKRSRSTAPTYGLGDRIAVMINAITSFSNKPLVYVFYLGMLVMGGAITAGLVLVWHVMFRGVAVAGWPSLIVSVWFLGGLTIFCLGVIGMYLSKVFMETKDRPYTIVRAVHRAEAPAP